jgi:uncharacterized SAM-binding protein YcdF (DUF218 family)
LDSLAALVKNLLIPGTLTFLLFGLTVGVLLLFGPRRFRPAARWWLAVLALSYWLGSLPAIADVLATRFHARDSRPVSMADVSDARAIVVLGAGIRTSYMVGGHLAAVPDPQTIFNAIEAARIYQLFPDGLTIVASGGRQSDDQQAEAEILKDWLMAAGVPAERITLESGSRTTREQAQRVAPILKTNHWERFVLVTPPVQGPRASAVFRHEGVDPISVAAPYSSDVELKKSFGWIPNGGALRATERATYDYFAWVYYWLRGWLR